MQITLFTKILIGYLALLVAAFAMPWLLSWTALSPGIRPWITLVVGVGLALILAWALSRMLSRVKDLNRSAEEISRGDLSRPVPAQNGFFGTDEIDALTISIAHMQENLRDLVSHTQRTAGSVSDAANELQESAEGVNVSSLGVSSSMEKIARGAELQNELVERTSKLIQEIAASIDRTAKSADDAARSSTETSTTAQSGGKAAAGAAERLGKVFGRIENASEMVIDFGAKTQQIDKVVQVISGIAQQTNLLALNATIEAARAGEYGRGFAVVAEEIRKLAEQAARSADQISRLAEDISHHAEQVVGAMEEATDELGEGREELSAIIKTLEGIVRQAMRGAEKVDHISTFARQQLEGSAEMVRATANISEVAKDNAHSTDEVRSVIVEQTRAMQQMAASAQELLALSQELTTVVQRFRL